MKTLNRFIPFAACMLCWLTLPMPVGAAGVVGNGTSASCTEAALDTALGGGGMVTFDCGALPVTISITTTKNIADSTTIDGGDLITLDGGGAQQLFTVESGESFTVRHITLANGRTVAMGVGGAAISSDGGAVTIDHSTLSGNSTANSGCAAVLVLGAALTIEASTFSGNHIDASGQGGAFCINNTASLAMTNSTISGNFSTALGGGGGISVTGPATITNSTIIDNTSNNFNGAINALGDAGIVTLVNTIVANNPGGNCLAAAGASFVDGGFNLQNPGTSCGASIPVADPKVLPLASNGGSTQTMALPAGSPALDKIPLGSNGCGTTIVVDQRDVSRPQPIGGSCDIGAYEAMPDFSAAVPAVGSWGQIAVTLLLLSAGALMILRRS